VRDLDAPKGEQVATGCECETDQLSAGGFGAAGI
jgi:hypothetical protein